MKLDDRDIVCEQDYTTLSNAELVAHIELYAKLMHTTPLSGGEWLDDIIGPAHVLLARAEAASALAYERLEAALFAEQRATDAELRAEEAAAEANDAAKELIELKERFDAMESIAKYQLIEMAALVAELETTRQTLVALTARVAELTTERNTTGRRAFNAEAENQRLAAENRRLAARVAELEAAQEWQSRSETPNAIDTYLVYRAAPPQNEPWRYDFAVWEDDGWDTEGFTHYRPLPPAPNVQEPTP